MMAYEIRALPLGGILDQSIRLYREHFWHVIAVVGTIGFLPALAAEGVRVAYNEWFRLEDASDLHGMMFRVPFLLAYVIATVLYLVVAFAASAAVSYSMTQRYMGSEPGVAGVLRQLRARASTVFRAALAYTLGLLGRTLLLIVPGVLFALAWYVVEPVIMFEGKSAGEATKRSNRLMRGEKGKAFVMMFLFALIEAPLYFCTELVPSLPVQVVLGACCDVVMTGFGGIVITVFYFSARCKAEHFDLELLAASIEQDMRGEEAIL